MGWELQLRLELRYQKKSYDYQRNHINRHSIKAWPLSLIKKMDLTNYQVNDKTRNIFEGFNFKERNQDRKK
jgi:hypothetical protein